MDALDTAGVGKEDVVSYANTLLSKCNIEFTIEDAVECTSDLFLALYHAILGDFPSGTLIDCNSTEAQVHNVKCIVETLSTDYLKVDLSHISPSDVVGGGLLSVFNLLEILDGLLDYLLEKIDMDSDSGDEGDIDSDQLSENAKAIALQTIQKEIRRPAHTLDENSLSSTAELIALGEPCPAVDKPLLPREEFVPLLPQISLTPDICSLSEHEPNVEHELSTHTLHSTTLPNEPVPSDISASDIDNFKALPTLSKDMSGIIGTFAEMHVDSTQDNADQKPPPSSPGSSIVVSDSGASMDSEQQRKRLDVQLDDAHTTFILKDKNAFQHDEESSGSEPVDVADGGVKGLDESEDNLRPTKERFEPEHTQPKAKEKDWQAMLDNLQKTVEESKKIRQQYFSSSRTGSGKAESSDEFQSSLGDDTIATEEALNGPSPTRRKNVRFEDTISTKTAKELKNFRKLLQQERQLQDEKNLILSRNYQDHLDEVRESEQQKLAPLRSKAKETEKQLKGTLQQQKRVKSKGKSLKTKRSGNLTDAAKWKCWKPPGRTKISPARSRTGKPEDTSRSTRLDSINEYDLLPKLLDEFPQLELPPATLNDMWHKQFRQIEQLTSAAVDHKNKKRRSEMQLQESHRKHELLINIMQKEHDHTQHMRDIRERAAGQKEAQRTLQDRRLQTARIRRYYRDYHIQMRSRMLKRRTKEERIFKRLFEDGLAIQKARLRELRKYARDKRGEQQKRQMDEIQSLENYYRDQFNILAETLASEREDLKIRDTAQLKLVRQMKRGLRQKMEKEISNLQEMIARDDDDTYFREIEADRLRRQLQLATYHAKFKD